MSYKNYYAILGVDAAATPEEIRRAYRTLAVKYHPDKNNGNAAACEKFVEINEANQVLGDPAKRKTYDQFGADRKQYEARGSGTGSFDWSRYARPGSSRGPAMNPDQYESMFGGDSDGDLFDMLFGRQGGLQSRAARTARRGADLRAETTISLEDAFHGASQSIRLEALTIKVAIPVGIASGQVLRIAGKGMAGYSGGGSGDLYLSIVVSPHADFHRKGNDLYRDCQIGLYTAILGGKALIKTLKGAVKVDVQPNTPNNAVLRLQGLGMPVFGTKNEYGSLFVTVDVLLPEHPGTVELDLFRQLAAVHASPSAV